MVSYKYKHICCQHLLPIPSSTRKRSAGLWQLPVEGNKKTPNFLGYKHEISDSMSIPSTVIAPHSRHVSVAAPLKAREPGNHPPRTRTPLGTGYGSGGRARKTPHFQKHLGFDRGKRLQLHKVGCPEGPLCEGCVL